MKEPKYRFIDKELNIPTFNLPKPAPYVYGYMIASADPNRYKILKRVLIWWKPISFETFTKEIMELVGYEKALRKKAFQVEMEKAERLQILDKMFNLLKDNK